MNAKQSKKLRKQAQLVAEQQNIPHETDYDLKTFKKVYQSFDGKYHSYQVYTVSMKLCVRSVYQSLKKNFKRGIV